MHLWFFSYWCLKLVELLQSKKRSFSIFLVLKKLNKIKKVKNHSKLPKLARHSFFKQLLQKLNIFLVFHWKFNPVSTCNLLCGSTFEQQYLENGESFYLHKKRILKGIKFYNDIQVDRLCICNSLVFDI